MPQNLEEVNISRGISTLSFLLLLLALPVFAQIDGKIVGRVIDKSTKQPLPGANVVLVGTENGAATDLNGSFVIESVGENIHKLRVSFIGYQSHLETDVRVVRGKTAFVEDIELVQSSIQGEKVVFTNNAPEDTREPVSNYVVAREEIIRAPGAAGDIFRALEAMPGVSTSGGEFSAFSVRGGSPRDNVILVDNIPFGKLTHFDGGNEEEEAQGGRFSIFAPGVIERANFRAGGFSAEYGGKFSSLVDLKIREGNKEAVTIDGRVDVLGWEVNYDGPLRLRTNTGLFVSARGHDFKRILDLTGQKDLGHPRFKDIIIKTTTDVNTANKISLLAIFAPEKFDRTPKHVFESDDFAQIEIVDLDESKMLLGLNWRLLTSKHSFWQNTIYYGKVDSEIDFGRSTPIFENGQQPQSVLDFTSRNVISEEVLDKELGLRSVINFLPGKSTTFTLGIEISQKSYELERRQHGLDTLYSFDATDFRPDPAQEFIIRRPEHVDMNFNADKRFFASFSQVSFQPLNRLTLNAGLRHEYNQFSKEHYLSPRGSLSYRLNDKTRLAFASGIYYQTPRMEIFTASTENFNLGNEKSTHAIASLTRYLGDDLKFIAEAYYKNFDDLVVWPDRTSLVRTNTGNGSAHGLDLSMIHSLVDKFYGQVNYSYAESKRDDHNGLGEYPSDFNQRHTFSVLAGYEFNKEWTISSKWRFATGRPQDSFITHNNVFADADFVRFSKEITGNNGDRLRNFHTFNFRIDYRKQPGKLALVSFLDIVNVYNYLNVNQERFLELTGKVEEEGFGILPTMGLKLEF